MLFFFYTQQSLNVPGHSTCNFCTNETIQIRSLTLPFKSSGQAGLFAILVKADFDLDDFVIAIRVVFPAQQARGHRVEVALGVQDVVLRVEI